MIWEILASIVILGVVAAVGIKNGIDWSRDRGTGFGKSHMEELGVKDDKKEYRE